MKKVIVALTIMGLFLANSAFAENKTFVKEYTYLASDIDSKVSSRAIALEQVKRALLEQLGTYLTSETEVKNFQMTKDQITTLTAGIVSAEVIEEKWDGRSYYLKAKIAADPNEVAKTVDALRTNVQKSKDLEASKKKVEEAMREVERLKQELALAKGDFTKKVEYDNAIKELSSADFLHKGNAFIDSKDFENAIAAYTKAIELDPKYAMAYYNRGNAYRALGKREQTITDYSKAIELDPKYVYAYNNLGAVYRSLGKNEQAIADFNKAIELNPKDAYAYSNRGNAHRALGKNEQAIADFNKAIELDPKFAMAYYNRGSIYRALGSENVSIQDFKMAAQLGMKEAQDYLKSHGIKW
jgi:tetratricopeptide (TPR) repeat protein